MSLLRFSTTAKRRQFSGRATIAADNTPISEEIIAIDPTASGGQGHPCPDRIAVAENYATAILAITNSWADKRKQPPIRATLQGVPACNASSRRWNSSTSMSPHARRALAFFGFGRRVVVCLRPVVPPIHRVHAPKAISTNAELTAHGHDRQTEPPVGQSDRIDAAAAMSVRVSAGADCICNYFQARRSILQTDALLQQRKVT